MENTKTQVAELKIGDVVLLTKDAAAKLPELYTEMRLVGGVIQEIKDGVAEVHVTTVHKIHLSKIIHAAFSDASDPLPAVL